MTVGTYVRQQKRDARFKFDMIRDHLESTYQLIQDQFFSKFNGCAKLRVKYEKLLIEHENLKMKHRLLKKLDLDKQRIIKKLSENK